MSRCSSLWLLCALGITGCSTSSLPEIVSEKYVHKYGFEVSEEEWESRSQEGEHIALLQNGVEVKKTYEKGKLHGPTTYTYPHSKTVEKLLVYSNGTLLKETSFDLQGMPIREDLYEIDNHVQITLWNEQGVPLSIEEYEEDRLLEAQYFTPEHTLEGSVQDGIGYRYKRERKGELLSKDTIQDGYMIARITFHPSGEIHTVSHYKDYQLHGEQEKFAATGKPLLKLHWNNGVLDGYKITYRNGWKVSEIPFVQGKREGIERHFDDLGNLTAEIEWKNDKKHGMAKFYADDLTETEWFYKGQTVNAEKFQTLEERDLQFAKFSFER